MLIPSRSWNIGMAVAPNSKLLGSSNSSGGKKGTGFMKSSFSILQLASVLRENCPNRDPN
eukprot:5564576-Amphidinium_carterae.1